MADPIRITIPHSLGKAEARKRIAGGVETLKGQLGAVQIGAFRHDWRQDCLDFTARGLGQAISGKIDIQENCGVAEVQLPAFLQGLAGALKKRLSAQTQLLLTKK